MQHQLGGRTALHQCSGPPRTAWILRATPSGAPSAPLGGLLAPVAALIVVCGGAPLCPVAHAYNVRLEDVESPQMQAGLRAATTGQLATAEQIFSGMLESDPKAASVWSNLGNVHMGLGRPRAAVDDYSHAIALAPEAPVPYLNRAIAEEELGVRFWEEGQAALAQGEWAQALADCDRAIQLDPREFAAHFNRGNVAMRLDDWEEAEASFSRAADLAPGIAGYRLRHAQLAFQTGHRDQAIQLMRGIARKYPQYAEAHASLAAALWSEGRTAAAEGAFKQAMDLELKWNDLRFVRVSTRWPPALYDALGSLLAIS